MTARALLKNILLLITLVFSGYGFADKNIIVLGDSLSAAYGIDERDGWVQLLRDKLTDEAIEATVINASISGETSGGGLNRLPKLLDAYQPDLLIIELGGNDGLRGYPVKRMQNNLASIIDQGKQQGSKVLMLGMQIPPNYGARYSALFFESFEKVSKQQDVPLVPFFLEGIGTNPELMQADGIHPVAEAQSLMLENVWPSIQALIAENSAYETGSK